VLVALAGTGRGSPTGTRVRLIKAGACSASPTKRGGQVNSHGADDACGQTKGQSGLDEWRGLRAPFSLSGQRSIVIRGEDDCRARAQREGGPAAGLARVSSQQRLSAGSRGAVSPGRSPRSGWTSQAKASAAAKCTPRSVSISLGSSGRRDLESPRVRTSAATMVIPGLLDRPLLKPLDSIASLR
jgi:hypothetical protein